MPGLVPGIHVFPVMTKTWMAGTSPAMTIVIHTSPASRREAGLLRSRPSLDLGVGDLAARVLLPDVDRVIDAGYVALLVVGQLPDHGVELHAGLDLRRDLLGIERFRRFRSLLDHLHRGVAV